MEQVSDGVHFYRQRGEELSMRCRDTREKADHPVGACTWPLGPLQDPPVLGTTGKKFGFSHSVLWFSALFLLGYVISVEQGGQAKPLQQNFYHKCFVCVLSIAIAQGVTWSLWRSGEFNGQQGTGNEFCTPLWNLQ